MMTQNDTNNLRSWFCRAALGGADRLAAYGEGALPAAASARVERHLAACAACREELATLRQVSALLLARRPAAPPPARDLWQRIQAEIEAVPAPVSVRAPRRSFLAPTLGAAAMAALAAVAVLTTSRPDADDGSSHPAPTVNDRGTPPVALVSPGRTVQMPKFDGNALAFGARTGLHVARIASGLLGKPARGNAENVSLFVPDKQIAAVRSASVRQSKNDFSATRDPFRPLQTRRDRSGPVAKYNGRHGHDVMAFAPVAPPVQSGRQEKEAAATGSVTGDVTPPTPGSEEPRNTVPSTAAAGNVSTISSAAAISAAVASAEDPSGPSPTLTAARGVAADDSAVTRYLSDSRRSGLFRYASSQTVSTPSQPELLR